MKKIFLLTRGRVIVATILAVFTLASTSTVPAAAQSTAGQSVVAQSAVAESAKPGATLTLMKKVADWQLDHWAKAGMKWPAYDWVNAVCYTGISALARVSGDSTYYRSLYTIGENLDWNTGPHRTMADDYCIGQLYSELYTHYREPRMLIHFRGQCDTICTLPHSDSLEWKNDVYLREWAWCDALFMGPAGLAELSTVTGDRKYLATAVRLWWKTTDYLLDLNEWLYFRDSRFFDKKEANGQKVFWSRGNGWVLAGLARLLAQTPESFEGREKLVRLFRQMAGRINSLQQPDGTWRTSLLDPEHYPGKETSGTALDCFALAWGVNHGLLSREAYGPAIRRAWEALKAAVQPDGKLGFVQVIGDQPGSSNENSTEAYGTGAFLLAGAEILVLEGR